MRKTNDNALGIVKRNRDDVLANLKSNPMEWEAFNKLTPGLQEELIRCCMGEQGIRITYDRVFKHLFNPRVHPERLEQLMGAILGEEVEILEILNNEGTQMQEDSSFVIMDVVVRLISGGIVHVDMQKIGYMFPIQRTACYSADLMMRQYIDLKKAKKKAFTFADISKIYSIVIMENSSSIFQNRDDFKHHGKVVYDSRINLDYPCENVFICLDNFLKIHHTDIKNKSDAWFAFLAITEVTDIIQLCNAFPEFIELYQEMFEFCKDIKEMVHMFSEVLWEISKNEERLVMQEWKENSERTIREAEERVRKAELETKEKVRKAELEAKEKVRKAELEAKEKVRKAELEAKEKVRKAELEAKEKVRKVELEVQKAKDEAQKVKDEVQKILADITEKEKRIAEAEKRIAQLQKNKE